MVSHDAYGKAVLAKACELAGDRLVDKDRRVPICDGILCDLDGMLASGIAVEIESRVNKQVRGALLNLLVHPKEEADNSYSGPVRTCGLRPHRPYGHFPTRGGRLCETMAAKLSPDARFRCDPLLRHGGNQ